MPDGSDIVGNPDPDKIPGSATLFPREKGTTVASTQCERHSSSNNIFIFAHSDKTFCGFFQEYIRNNNDFLRK